MNALPCKRVFLPGAKHDALNEIDATRNIILSESVAFFAQQRGAPAGATGAGAPAAGPYSAK